MLFLISTSLSKVVGSLPSGDEVLLTKIYSTNSCRNPGLAMQWFTTITKFTYSNETTKPPSTAVRNCLQFHRIYKHLSALQNINVFFIRGQQCSRLMWSADQRCLWRSRWSDHICASKQVYVSRAGTSNYIPQYLWDVITCPYTWYLLLAHMACYVPFYSSPPSVAYMRHWTESALVQIMACRLFGAKPLSKPMLGYCQLDP